MKDMRKTIVAAMAAAAVMAVAPAAASAARTDAAGMEKIFTDIPDSVKTAVYWYWISDNISKEGVVKDLHAMKEAGINRAFLGSMGIDGVPYGKVKFMSPEWWEITETALETAGELGIEIGIFNSPGWSQSGGPWVKPEEAMRYLRSSTAEIKGGGVQVKTRLEGLEGHRPVKVIAYPSQSPETAVQNIVKKEGETAAAEFTVPDTWTVRTISISAKSPIRTYVSVYADHGEGYVQVKNFTMDRSNPALNVGFDPFAPVVESVHESCSRIKVGFSQEGAGDLEVRLSTAPVVERFPEKTLAKMFQTPLPMWGEYMWPEQAGSRDTEGAIDPDSVIDITGNVKGDILEWDVPDGDWTVMYTWMEPTGVTNSPAVPEATGLEIDKMSRRHIESHFNAYIGKILERIPPEKRKSFRTVVQDSYETGGLNWTDDMEDYFIRTYGYDPTPYIPALYGQTVGSRDISDRFLWDLRRAVADRVAYDYVGGLRDICHSHGLGTWLECYGHWGFPGEFLKYGGQSDEVSGEFWSEGSLGDIENRAASSCGHIYGKNRIWAESCTSGGPVFYRYPRMMKQRLDRFFAEGINSTLLHLYIQQPDDRKPGMAAWFGNEFNRNNTWFPYMDLFTGYLKRCNYMLQQGTYVADAAYFIGEDAPKMTGVCNPKLPYGYSFDYINAEVLMEHAHVHDGRLVLDSGVSYGVLVLPDQKTMRPEVLSAIDRLVREGLTVTGPAPERSPSLSDFPKADRKVAGIASRMWKGIRNRYGKGSVWNPEAGMKRVLSDIGLEPDLQTADSSAVRFIHRHLDDCEIYFISNQDDRQLHTSLRFRTEGMVPQLWDPLTGEISAVSYRASGSGVTADVELPPLGSTFVVFRKDIPDDGGASVLKRERRIGITSPWTIRFSPYGTDSTFQVTGKLFDWSSSENDDIRFYSGTAEYSTKVRVDLQEGKRYRLDLGKVMVMAKVWVNGRYAGGVWTDPYSLDVTGLLKDGMNDIHVHVVNNWMNRLIGDSLLPESRRTTWTNVNPWNSQSQLQESGLAGPVSIEILDTGKGTESTLREGFAAPPAQAKARTWWHWINGNVTRSGITADLEAMKDAGIQEAQIFNVDQGFPEGNAEYMSEEWLDLIHFAAREASRLGIELGFNNAAGWSSSGGPWVKPEYGMQTLVYSITAADGSRKGYPVLPQPQSRLGFYRDIAVIAFPTPASDEKVDRIELKSLSGAAFSNHLMPEERYVSPAAAINTADILDLTELMDSTGCLHWDVPQGKWTVIRFGHTPTGTENHPANRTGRGLECDKLSSLAMDEYWKGGVAPVLDRLGPLVGNTLTNCMIDSYEVGCGNWTEGFSEEFRRLAGYDITPYLPALAGYYVGSGNETERFLWDFRKVTGRLMADNYYGRFAWLCMQNGMFFSTEPYEGPYNSFEAGSWSQLPMGEFWVGGTSFCDMSRLAASIAHINSLPYVGAEAFTADGRHSRWLNHPASMKPLGDWAWTEGVNRFIFHTFTHQPWEVAPGMTFHMYGCEMNRHNTWWRHAGSYMDYIGRSQFLLQQGIPCADILVFAGESSPNDGMMMEDIRRYGYDYDMTDAAHLMELAVSDGQLVSPAGNRYRLLVLPQSRMMTPETILKLEQLAGDGACIIGPEPYSSPSLERYPECDSIVATAADRLWKKDRLIRDTDLRTALDSLGLQPDFQGEKDLLYIHRKAGDTDIYFISNQLDRHRKAVCNFRVSGKHPERWDPRTGETEDTAVWEEKDGYTSICLDFQPEESCFIIFFPGRKQHMVSYAQHAGIPAPEAPSDLRIIKAEYGYFLPEGIADVTGALKARINAGMTSVTADNSLAGDPATGVVKQLRIKYMSGDSIKRMTVPELYTAVIPEEDLSAGFRILQALYGAFPADFDDNLPPAARDVTMEMQEMAGNGKILFSPVEMDPSAKGSTGDRLHLVYESEGKTYDRIYGNKDTVDLSVYQPLPELIRENGRLMWKTPYRGTVECILSDGSSAYAGSGDIPAQIVPDGAWEISFLNRDGSELCRIISDSLHSWTESEDTRIRYFSGTAVYSTRVMIPAGYLDGSYRLELDLGSVSEIAEVSVNGQSPATIWHRPFVTDITEMLHTGWNTIEIKVTNLWPNRLIGDEMYPEDTDWGEWTLNSWPEWLETPETRESERSTFTTWKHWKASDKLLESGMKGPVRIIPYAVVPLTVNP